MIKWLENWFIIGESLEYQDRHGTQPARWWYTWVCLKMVASTARVKFVALRLASCFQTKHWYTVYFWSWWITLCIHNEHFGKQYIHLSDFAWIFFEWCHVSFICLICLRLICPGMKYVPPHCFFNNVHYVQHNDMCHWYMEEYLYRTEPLFHQIMFCFVKQILKRPCGNGFMPPIDGNLGDGWLFFSP